MSSEDDVRLVPARDPEGVVHMVDTAGTSIWAACELAGRSRVEMWESTELHVSPSSGVTCLACLASAGSWRGWRWV